MKAHIKIQKNDKNHIVTKTETVPATIKLQIEQTPYETLCRLTGQPIYKMSQKTRKHTFWYTFERRKDHDIKRSQQRIHHQSTFVQC